MTCLLSATRCYVSGEVDQKKQQQLVLTGLHAFQLYAQEHWVDYVLVTSSSHGTTAFDNLHMLMVELCSRLDEIHQRESKEIPQSEANASTADDDQLRCIQHLPRLHEAGVAILRARSLGPRAFDGRDSTSVLFKNDTVANISSTDADLAAGPATLLRQALFRYQAIVRDLLSKHNVVGVGLDKLAGFQETHKDFAYTCRLGGCRRQAAGFETEKLRDQHEEAHRSLLRCEVDGCQYPPFSSMNAFRRHVRNLHTEKRQHRSIRRPRAETVPKNPSPRTPPRMPPPRLGFPMLFTDEELSHWSEFFTPEASRPRSPAGCNSNGR